MVTIFNLDCKYKSFIFINKLLCGYFCKMNFSLIIDLMDFKRILIEWYSENRRDLPWRNTTNPYYIWVSEIILQQTRVAQGLSYYLKFLDSFPTVFDLANASEDAVLKVWQGLGYYTRARNLRSAAQHIVDKYQGEIPDTFDELIKIKGIGQYSAGAIASFAFKHAVPAIDGNVYRIIARVFGVFTLSTTAKGRREFYDIVVELMDKTQPDVFNQALLDFGALQCVPKSPKCEHCPFGKYCFAYMHNLVHVLPTRGKKTAARSRYFTYLIIKYNEYTFINRRKNKDIWQGLYEFPLIETHKPITLPRLTKHSEWKKIFGRNKHTISYVSEVVKHQLSHQTLYTQFIMVDILTLPRILNSDYEMVLATDVDQYSTPKVIDNFMVAEPASKYFLNNPE